MADELDDFIVALTTKMEEMTGVLDAPVHPPEGLSAFPVVICYFVGGTFTYSQAGPAIGVHTVHADVHLGRSQLPHDEEYARPFILRGLVKFAANVQMDSTCDHCLLTGYEYGSIGYGSKETFGVRYILEVKIKHSGITVTA
jgi:hypothetical protein